VPGLEEGLVSQVVPTRYGFDLYLEDGEIAPARRLIVAAGIRAYEYLPPQLANLPSELASHSAQHVKVDGFRGRAIRFCDIPSILGLAARANRDSAPPRQPSGGFADGFGHHANEQPMGRACVGPRSPARGGQAVSVGQSPADRCRSDAGGPARSTGHRALGTAADP
jgi:hypothetical protein